MTIKTHGRMMTHKTIGADQLAVSDYGTDNQALVTDGEGSIRWATVGIGGSVGSSTYVENIFVGDDDKTKFQMTATAAIEESLLVFVDGVAQPTSTFTLSSSGAGIGVGGNLDEINISPALATGQQLRVCHLGINTAIADGSITGAKLSFPPAAAGDLLYHNGTQYDRFPIGTALQVFRTNAGANAPEWVDATQAALPAVGADGNVLTSTGSIWQSEAPPFGVGGELVSHQFFSTEGTSTWTRPSGVKRIRVWVTGSGGRSGAIPVNNEPDQQWAAAGGGSGATAMSTLDVSDLSTATIVIGDNAATTTAGRNVTFAGTGITTLVGGGGLDGGNPNGPGGVSTTIGGGGTATGGDLNITGMVGSWHAQTLNALTGGDGGHAPGPVGGTYGMGARGAVSNAPPVTPVLGGSGCVFIEEYADASAYLIGEKLVSSQLFTDDGTWTRPSNVSKIEVWVVGIGGSSHATGGPGGAGGTAYSILDVTNLASATIVCPTAVQRFNCTFAGTGITTLTGVFGGNGQSNNTGGVGGLATGGQLNISGSDGEIGDGGVGGDGGLPWLGGHFGKGSTAGSGNAPRAGGCVYIKEYSDPSLVQGSLGGIAKEEVFIIPEGEAGDGSYPLRGIWTKDSGIKSIEVFVGGGGGAGGGGNGAIYSGTGGNGGEGGFGQRVIDVSSIDTIDYAIGFGGGHVGINGPRHSTFGQNGTLTSNPMTVTVNGSGVVTAVTHAGSTGDYITQAPLIFIEPNASSATGAGGTGATATVQFAGGVVTGITVTNGGSGYVSGQVVAFYGTGGTLGLGGTAGTGDENTEKVDGSDGADGVSFGVMGNVVRQKNGLGRVSGGGVGTTGTGGTGQHGGIYIRSYR